MKKLVLILLAALLLLSGCTQQADGTYYPNYNEMKKALNEKDYTVTTIEFAKDSDTPGEYLSAMKGDEFIAFYWLDDPEDVPACEDALRDAYPKYNKFISVANDAKHGNLTFCATTQAVQDAGIRLVEVKEIKVEVN